MTEVSHDASQLQWTEKRAHTCSLSPGLWWLTFKWSARLVAPAADCPLPTATAPHTGPAH